MGQQELPLGWRVCGDACRIDDVGLDTARIGGVRKDNEEGIRAFVGALLDGEGGGVPPDALLNTGRDDHNGSAKRRLR